MKTVTSWTIAAAGKRSHAICHQHQPEALSVWGRMTTPAQAPQMDMRTTIGHRVATGEIEVLPTLMHLEAMTIDVGRFQQIRVARASDKIESGRERIEVHRQSTGCLHDQPTSLQGQMRRTVGHRLLAEQTTSIRTSRTTTVGHRAIMIATAEGEATPESLTDVLRTAMLTVHPLVTEIVIETTIANAIVEVILISEGHAAGVLIGQGVRGKSTRNERDYKTVNASFIGDEANAYFAVDLRKGSYFGR